MSKVHFLKDYKPGEPRRPREITFFAPAFKAADGEMSGFNLTVTVENGDVLSVLGVVRNDGGAWCGESDGAHWFLPWPCAAVRIRDL